MSEMVRDRVSPWSALRVGIAVSLLVLFFVDLGTQYRFPHVEAVVLWGSFVLSLAHVVDWWQETDSEAE